MNLLIFTCILQIILWPIISYIIYRKTNDLFNTGVILSSLFVIFFPVKILGSYFGYSYIQNPVYELGPNFVILSMLIANISIFLIVLPFLIGKEIKVKGIEKKILFGKNRKVFAIFISFISFIVLKLILFGFDRIYAIIDIDILLDTPELMSLERAGGGWKAILHAVAFVIIFYHFDLLSRVWSSFTNLFKFVYILFFLASLYPLLAITYSKYETIYPVFLCLIVFHYSRLRSGKNSFNYFHGLLMALSFSVLIIITGMLRYGIYVGTFLEWLFIPFDSADNFAFILSRLDNFIFGDMFLLPTIENLFISPIPRQLWVDKPYVNGFLRIQEMYLPYHFSGYTGETVSTTIMGELMVSGGILIMVIGSIIIGLCLYYLYYKFVKSFNKRSMLCIHCFVILNIYEIYRGGTRIVPVFIIVIVASILVIPILEKLSAVRLVLQSTKPSLTYPIPQGKRG